MISAREQLTPVTKKPAATIMTKVQHDLRHYQSFTDLNTRLRAFQSGNLLGKCRAQTNAREPVKSFRRVARLCFYRHNPFKFWTVLSDPEHPIRAYQIMTEFGAGRVFLARVRTALTREHRRGRSSSSSKNLRSFLSQSGAAFFITRSVGCGTLSRMTQ
jgi:hypothetical protein